MNHRLLARPLTRLVLATLCVVALTSVAWACPSCKDALESADGTSGNYITGFFWSIIFMMSMPFVILGTFSGGMYLAVRRARAAEAAKAAAGASVAKRLVERAGELIEA